jgi:hypothetical protein
MNTKIAVWLFFRAARWLTWLFFLGWSAYFHFDRAPHLTGFGHLQHRTEAMFFGLAGLGVFLGFMELMIRERAGIKRADFRLMPPASDSR